MMVGGSDDAIAIVLTIATYALIAGGAWLVWGLGGCLLAVALLLLVGQATQIRRGRS